jgi:hypothetical protein
MCCSATRHHRCAPGREMPTARRKAIRRQRFRHGTFASGCSTLARLVEANWGETARVWPARRPAILAASKQNFFREKNVNLHIQRSDRPDPWRTDQDVAAAFAILAGQPLLPTRSKFGGATKGTSIASIASRQVLNYDLKFRLPTLTGASLSTLRISLTRNLGAFVGRSVPVVGWVIVAHDVVQIMWNTVATFNCLVLPEDRLMR